MEGNALLALAAVSFIAVALLRYWQLRRRRTKSGIEWRQYKARLSGWVRLVELVFQIGFWIGLFFLLLFALLMLFAVAHRHFGAPSDNTFGIIVIASLIAALIPASLLANIVSWLIPPMRRANLAAMEGIETASFRNANLGMAKMGAVLTPAALAIAIAAAVLG